MKMNKNIEASTEKLGLEDRKIFEFVKQQKQMAKGQRLEMLDRDLAGTLKLLSSVLLPVLKTLDGLELEYEMLSSNGVRIYADVFYPALGVVFECDGFVPHAEQITRDRFNFERMRMRSFALNGYRYMPFSRDELDKRPEACCRAVYELMGRLGGTQDRLAQLSVYQREVLRTALVCGGAFYPADVGKWLQLRPEATRHVLRDLLRNEYITKVGGSNVRSHGFVIGEEGKKLFTS